MRNGFLCLVLGLTLAACSSAPRLRMEAYRAPIDESVASNSYKLGSFKKIMVIPPSGTVRGQYDAYIAIFEREFLRNGITVISGAITGRVVLEANTEKRAEGGSDLSDAERALVMAKKSGADAILQIGEWAWSADAPKRFFIYDDSGEKIYREVTQVEYQNVPASKKYAFLSQELRFIGKLTNVINGEVVASFEIKSPANFNLPVSYEANLQVEDDRAVVVQENFTYGGSGSTWFPDAKRATEVSIIKTVCSRILVGPSASPVALVPAPVMPPKEETRAVATDDAKKSAEAPAEPSGNAAP